jgi:hypothetical protein
MLAAALALPGTRPKLLLALAPVESFSKGSDSRKIRQTCVPSKAEA